MGKGVISRGIECPLIKEGDNIINIIVDAVLEETAKDWDQMSYGGAAHEPGYYLHNKDIIGITESVVARALGQYVTIDEIAKDIEDKYGKDATIAIIAPIYSRNRFSMILKGIARAAKELILVMPDFDEVGNPRGINPFTGVNIEEYYKSICTVEGCKCTINGEWSNDYKVLDCRLHTKQTPKPTEQVYYHLDEICSHKSPDWGLLGTNKATENRLKLFPSVASGTKLCKIIKKNIKRKTGKDVIVCIYGDGCFRDPVGGIWEFADPVTMPAYTDWELMESTPNEIKLKAFIDEGKTEEEIKQMIAEKKDLVGSMSSQGTTPRVYRDLIASLMDLTSGSGDRGTPVVLIQNYFRD